MTAEKYALVVLPHVNLGKSGQKIKVKVLFLVPAVSFSKKGQRASEIRK